MVRLETQDHAGEQANKHDDHGGPRPYVIDLLYDLDQLFRSQDLQHRQKEENHRRAQMADPPDRCPADCTKRPH